MIENIGWAFLLTIFAGLSTTIGAFVTFFIKKPSARSNFCYLCLGMGFSAGVMIFISFVELVPESIENIGFLYAMIAFFAGMLVIYFIDTLIPHVYEEEKEADLNKKLMASGILIAVGIAIHNFPEGIAVFFSSLSSLKFGIPIAIAIALHNIPEGISVAMPIYYATKKKRKAFRYSFLAGVAEPIGALVSIIILYRFINDTVLNLIFAAVAGVMVFISFDELLPYAYKHHNKHTIIFGILAGMLVMAVSLYLL